MGWEDGHEEDGLKRMVDSLVSKGTDIPDASVLFAVLSKTDTTIKLFFVEQEAIDRAVSEMPNDVPPSPSTMKMHQAVTLGPGERTYRDVSCLCTARQYLSCECFNTKHFIFNQEKAPKTTENQWQIPEVVGKWCVLKYDSQLYPGIITDISNTHVKVCCMKRIGANRFYWPAREDIIWYPFEDILCTIPPARQVTARYMEIDKDVWAKLETASEKRQGKFYSLIECNSIQNTIECHVGT